MNQPPAVSIIIPFYNRLEWTHAAVQSVLAQTYQDLEIILIDDGSSDDYLTKYGLIDERIRYFRQDNRGRSTARNLGIRMALGKYIAFLDSDDLFLTDKLAIQMEQIEQKQAVFSHTSYMQVTCDEEFIDVKHSGLFSGMVYPRIITDCPIATPTVVIRRDILNKYEFVESVNISEDIILWAQIAKENEIQGIDIPLSKVRLHNNNAAIDNSAQLEGLTNRLEILVKGDKDLSPISRQRIASHIYLSLAFKLLAVKNYRLFLRRLSSAVIAWPLNFQIYKRSLKLVIMGVIPNVFKTASRLIRAERKK